MKKITSDILESFYKNSLEWWKYSVWINEIEDYNPFNKKWLISVIEKLFTQLNESWREKDTYIELIFHDVKNQLLVNKNNYLDSLLCNNYKVELLLNDNSELSRAFMNILMSKEKILPTQVENLWWKTHWVFVWEYLHIYIYPKKNKLYFIDEWIHGKNIDFVINEELIS